MLTPIMSLGSRSLVNCTRWNDRSRVAARACARVVLPTPGRSSMRRWPPARRQARASFTWVDFPSSTEFTWARARSRLARRAGSRLFAAVSGMFFTYPARRTSVSESRAARSQGDGVRHAGSVATPDGKVRAARVFWSVWAMQLAIKFWLSSVLAPFGDEAFYWQESRHLDWAYCDLPPLTVLLIRAGESLAGHGEFGMRLAFVLLGALLPLMLRRMAARHFGAQAGDVAGTMWLLLPLGATLGLLALPDLFLLFACIGALASLDAALASDRRRDWLALGAALALAWATHYRAAMLVFAGLAFFVLAPHGHASWRRAGLWLPLAVTLLGLVPVLIFNRQHAWQGVASSSSNAIPGASTPTPSCSRWSRHWRARRCCISCCCGHCGAARRRAAKVHRGTCTASPAACSCSAISCSACLPTTCASARTGLCRAMCPRCWYCRCWHRKNPSPGNAGCGGRPARSRRSAPLRRSRISSSQLGQPRPSAAPRTRCSPR